MAKIVYVYISKYNTTEADLWRKTVYADNFHYLYQGYYFGLAVVGYPGLGASYWLQHRRCPHGTSFLVQLHLKVMQFAWSRIAL